MPDKSPLPPALMRAVVCDGADKRLSTLHLRQLPVPAAGPGEVRVRLHAASLNPVDWKLADGTVPWLNAPLIMGLDGAGVIDQVGDDAGNRQVGDRVVWHGNLSKPGVFADYGIAPAHVLARIPDQVSFAAAAALPCAGMILDRRDPALVEKIRALTGGYGVDVMLEVANPGDAST